MRKKQILNLANSSMKDVIYYERRNYTEEVKQRHRIPIELSLLMIRSFIFVEMLKQHLHAV